MASIFRGIFHRKQALAVFVPMVLLYASSYFQRTAVPGTIFNELQSENGFSALQMAGVGASFIYVYALSQLIVGMLADKYGGMRVIAFGGAVFCVGALVFPFCTDLWLIYLCRMFTGLGASTMYLSIVRETDRLFGRENYAVVLGAVYFIGYGGGLMGTLPFERLISVMQWRTGLIVVGTLSLVLFIWFFRMQRKFPKEPVRNVRLSFRPLGKIIKNPLSWLILFCGTVNFATYFIIQTVFGKKFLQDFAHMSSAGAAASIFALTFICMGVLFCSSLISRLLNNHRRPLLIFSTALCLAVTIMMALGTWCGAPAWIFVLGYLLYAAVSGFSVIFSMSEQEVNSHDSMTQSAGFINMANYFLVAVFSLLIGALLDAFLPEGAAAAGKTVIYPRAAYQTLFGLLILPATISFIGSFFIPETAGHFLKKSQLAKS